MGGGGTPNAVAVGWVGAVIALHSRMRELEHFSFVGALGGQIGNPGWFFVWHLRLAGSLGNVTHNKVTGTTAYTRLQLTVI